jgi:hypothetical protein
MKKGVFFLILSITLGIIGFQTACSPTKVVVNKYNLKDTTLRPDGMTYFLPKKCLLITLTLDVYRSIKIKEYKDNLKPKEYIPEDVFATISKPIEVEEMLIPDNSEAFVIRFQNKGSSSNNLNTTINFDTQGMISTINTESTGVGAELLSATFNTAISFARFGNPVSALKGLDFSSRGGEDIPFRVLNAIDSSSHTFKRVVELSARQERVTIRCRDLIPEVTSGGPSIIITLDKNQKENPVIFKNTYFGNKNNEVNGLIYRTAIPVHTTIEVKNDLNITQIRQHPGYIAFDKFVLFPQFGPYSIAPVEIKGGRYQKNSIEFTPLTGALVSYTADKKSNKAENLRSLSKDIETLKQGIDNLKEEQKAKKKPKEDGNE